MKIKDRFQTAITMSVAVAVGAGCRVSGALPLTTAPSPRVAQPSHITYEVDLTHHEDDLFHVTLYPGKLTDEEKDFNFVRNAPGVHALLDFGRFVKSFSALDSYGQEIPSRRMSTNQWRISAPERVHRIVYDIEDSFDAEVEGRRMHPQVATGIEERYVILNTFGVFGFFDRLLSRPIHVRIAHKPEWTIGTALDRNAAGDFIADSFYHLADSPILLGELSYATEKIGGIDVDVFVYSPVEELSASSVLDSARSVLTAATELIGFAPVDRYVFLFYFHNGETARRNKWSGAGALEHSYSSAYALPVGEGVLERINGGIAHEFMHILTPLHLRSSVIADFDFSEVTADLHVWLYEGVTEWVGVMLRLRGGIMGIDEYFLKIRDKMEMADLFDPEYSLTRISFEWSTEEGRRQWGNVYNRGALVATLLDIRLLELSGGTRGLREVYLELIKRFGKDTPFDNESFFDVLVQNTYPEIRSFIDQYIIGTEELPYREHFAKVGIDYTFSQPAKVNSARFGIALVDAKRKDRYKIDSFSKGHEGFGLKVGDVLKSVFGIDALAQNWDDITARRRTMRAGDKYPISIERGGEKIELEGVLYGGKDYHVLRVSDTCSESQKRLREIWMHN